MSRPLVASRVVLLALASALSFSGCDEAADPARALAQPAAASAAQPARTHATALERARQYWASAEKGDWVATYDLLAPELQREQPVAVYLQQKRNHLYANMRVIEVVAEKDDLIFLRVAGQWTPNGPEARRVQLEPGQGLTQELEWFQVWRWVGDQWCYLRPLRPEEFLEQYPDLQSGTPAPGPTSSR